MAGSWSVAEFLRDVCLVSRCIWSELGVEERGRLGKEGEDVFIAVVSGGCYAFAVLVVAVYGLGGVIVPICQCFVSNQHLVEDSRSQIAFGNTHSYNPSFLILIAL